MSESSNFPRILGRALRECDLWVDFGRNMRGSQQNPFSGVTVTTESGGRVPESKAWKFTGPSVAKWCSHSPSARMVFTQPNRQNGAHTAYPPEWCSDSPTAKMVLTQPIHQNGVHTAQPPKWCSHSPTARMVFTKPNRQNGAHTAQPLQEVTDRGMRSLPHPPPSPVV